MHITRPSAAPAFAAAMLALALAAAGCASDVPAPTPIPGGVLLTVETRGGRCVEGPCSTTIFVERDGLVRVAAKPPNELGLISEAELAALEAAILATDFEELRSHPFSGTCPTAFDGQEVVFEFGVPGGVERIATCETQVDWGSPLFVAAVTAVAPFLALPTR